MRSVRSVYGEIYGGKDLQKGKLWVESEGVMDGESGEERDGLR